MIDQSKPSLDELSHSGKKGMKWGVRKNYAENQIRVGNAARKVELGTAHKYDRATAGRPRNTAAAKRIADQKIGHGTRLATGEAKVSDLLLMYGTMTANPFIGALNVGKQPAGYGRKSR